MTKREDEADCPWDALDNRQEGSAQIAHYNAA
jgi:hypothetical protein